MTFAVYFDDDFVKHPRADVLRTAGFDVVIPRDVDMVGADDGEHLTTATALERVLISHNIADFHRLHAERSSEGLDHAGIVLVHQSDNLSAGEIVRRLLAIEEAFRPDGLTNQILFLTNFG